jgi:hypothetical protein
MQLNVGRVCGMVSAHLNELSPDRLHGASVGSATFGGKTKDVSSRQGNRAQPKRNPVAET